MHLPNTMHLAHAHSERNGKIKDAVSYTFSGAYAVVAENHLLPELH